MALALEMLIRGVYQLPAMAGQGNHWPLNDEEGRVLAQQTEACLVSLPIRQLDKASKFVAQVAPWIGLTTSVFVVTYARIQETRRLYRATRPAEPVQNGSGPSGNGAGPGHGAPSGHASPRMSHLFGEGE